MTSRAEPRMEPSVRDAHEMFRNAVDFAILCRLMDRGPQTRGQLAEDLELHSKTLTWHLNSLRERKLIDAIPLEDPDQRHRFTFRVREDEVKRVYRILGEALGL